MKYLSKLEFPMLEAARVSPPRHRGDRKSLLLKDKTALFGFRRFSKRTGGQIFCVLIIVEMFMI